MKKAYYLGLDIGTDSVGYAVTDREYNVLKFHGEPAWGVHLFEAASQSADRRAHRVARRRLDRRQQRVKLVQQLFAKEVTKIDPRFFIRQQESTLFADEKEERYSLFNDAGFTDKEYHDRWPTIHHLICDLMFSDEAFDVRLVYLACAWLVAHRGHFLNEIDKENVGSILDFSSVYQKLVDYMNDNERSLPWTAFDMDAFAAAVRLKANLTRRYKALAEACFGKSKVPKKELDGFPYNCEVLLKAIGGSKIKAKDLFLKPEYEEIKSFSLDSDDATLEEVFAELGDDAELIEKLKLIYDWGLLIDILGDAHPEDGRPATISAAKVAAYDRHAADLKLLKHIIRTYRPEKFNEVFRDSLNTNYVAYSYHGDLSSVKKKVDQAEFCKYIKGIVGKLTPAAEDADAFSDMLSRLELGTFMPKQRTTDNRVIPYQLYWYEMDLLLKQAQRYLPFLSEKDDTGLTVSEKLLSVFSFRVPYFVGPLNAKSSHAWVKRTEEKIYPWNFSQVVDLDASEKEFIKRMLNDCTYLPGEPALPRESLMYHRFTVLNEINNLKINGQPITVAQKQGIYNEVFLRHRKVTRKKIADWLLSNGAMQKGDDLSGVDIAIHSDLKPWHDFRRLLESGTLTEAQAEEIIAQRTYSEDVTRFRRWLELHFPQLPQDDIRYLTRLNYRDFGKLSARFLNGIMGTVDHATGECMTILRAMWETNENLMELLSARYDFAADIEAAREAYFGAEKKDIASRLDDMYISNAVKRPIIRTLDIVKEVMTAFGGAPEKIFIEMARGGTADQRGQRTKSRKDQLLELYAKCRDEDVRLLTQQLESMGEAVDSRLQSDKLFLYFMQLGRCLYTGEPISFEAVLHNDTSRYNIEHIYPRKLVKDDSIINNEILVDSKANGQKSDTYPVDMAIRTKMAAFWRRLKDNGLISEEKFSRLTRATGFTPDEKWGFINRQLTETTQSTKAVAELLKEICPDSQTVYVKSRLASEFRHTFNCLKSRSYNDLHHAKDAYLNIVCGNVYDMRFTRRWFDVDSEYSVRPEILYTRPVVRDGVTIWDGAPMKDKAVRYMAKNNIHLTRYAFSRQGQLFNQTIYKAAPGLIPVKADKPVARYGGYDSATICYFMLARYTFGKKSDIMVVPAELRFRDSILSDEASIVPYLKQRISDIIGKKVDSVELPLGSRPIKLSSIFSFDGFRTYLSASSTGGKKLNLVAFMPFSASHETEAYVKRLESYIEKRTKNPNFVYDAAYDKITAEKNVELYDLFTHKLCSTIYSKRMNNQASLVVKGREEFVSLDISTQAKVLLSILSLLGRAVSGCDLTAIGGSAASGIATVSSNLSNWKKNYSDVRIVDQSASGLWEKQSVNLLDLL